MSLAALSARADAPAEAEWRQHGRTASEQRFSPLVSINTNNVDRLGLAWAFELPTRRGQEATPIVVDGVLYLSGAWSQVFALDAKTGALKWSHDPAVPRATVKYACCDAVNRGVAVHAGNVYVGTLDGRLQALDATDGTLVWETVTVPPDEPYTITGAPRVVKDKVLIGNGGGEFGVRGYVSAYNVADGTLAWRFYTVPGNPAAGFENDAMAMAADTWNGEWWRDGGGGTVWDSMAYDAELDLLYIGVGNGSPWNRELRSPGGGDNLFLSSIVALKPDDGRYVWHYQTTPADNWDYTATQHMILADIEIDGRERSVLLQAPKNGFFYVLDRASGELLAADPYVAVNWAERVDLSDGRPVETKTASYQDAPQVTLPASVGGHNWMPMAYSPKTGLVYIPTIEIPHKFDAISAPTNQGNYWNTGTDFANGGVPADLAPALQRRLLKRFAKAALLAWDPVRQSAVWRVPHEHPWNGGVLATAGDLVFQGDALGFFSAYNAANGTRLWQAPANTGIVAAPISYAIDGEQYIAVLAGWGGALALLGGPLNEGAKGGATGRLLVYRLDGDATVPAGVTPKTQHSPPEMRSSWDAAASRRGAKLYARHCMVCHGIGAVGGGVIPDLRYTSTERHAVFDDIVRDGLLESVGMPAFAEFLSSADVDALHAYVVREAHRTHRAAQRPGWWRALTEASADVGAWALGLLQ